MRQRLSSADIKLINDYSFGKIAKEKLINDFQQNLLCEIDLSESLIEDSFRSADADQADLGYIFHLIQADICGLDINVTLLCRLLLEPWHFHHEDIAFLLEQLQDPIAIEALFATAQKRLPYLDYDSTHQLARKCIKALAAIKTPEAKEKLDALSHAESSIIQEYARRELDRL